MHGTVNDISVLEDAFIAEAREYGEANKISYTAWRANGVPAATLKRAGITRAA